MRNLIMALMALFFVTSAPALAQAAWRVSESSGPVSIIENGRARPATRGALLSGGAVVATGPRARAVLVHNRDYVIVSPSSRMRVPTEQQRGPRGLIQMVNESGTGMFRIERRATPHFAVQTPYLAAVVKGTVFSVTVDATGASVQVTEGAVEVSTADGGAAELVRPGMIGMVSASDLQLLQIQGENSRSIRSNGAPAADALILPTTEVGSYRGPVEGPAAIDAPVAEDPVALADSTDGLVSGNAGIDLTLVDLRDIGRPAGGDTSSSHTAGAGGGAPAAEDGNSGHGNDGDGADSGNPGNGGGNDNSGPGNDNGGGNDGASGGDDDGNNGGGNDDADDDDDDGNNGHGNDDDGDDASNPGNGGDNDNSGPGNDNGGGNDGASGGDDDGNNGHGNDDADDDDDDGNNGHGNDDDGDDASNPGHRGGHDADDDDEQGNSGHGNGGHGNGGDDDDDGDDDDGDDD